VEPCRLLRLVAAEVVEVVADRAVPPAVLLVALPAVSKLRSDNN